ncbi:MAG: 2-polyprenyl-3-methyl-6-methoxy-1,4-benzoquinone monooxygenase [Proteobacteria bacterium]|nr:2-polyprenyl-3-methyl-6-methoxy-1,4-benzoquinone monooxygenase [Pseudomonadota bacterium]
MALIEDAILAFDRGLKTLTGQAGAARMNPAGKTMDGTLDDTEREHAAGLMRVNHTGEICAQALYEGQAATARDPETRSMLKSAADEEGDHLAWCRQRLNELDAKPSVLDPLFYLASYTLGALTGMAGDKVSLGFVEATEDQVCAHLEDHLESLPPGDQRSREILKQMHQDEARHGRQALAHGGDEFSESVKGLMRMVSRVMTETSYRI